MTTFFIDVQKMINTSDLKGHIPNNLLLALKQMAHVSKSHS